MKLRIAFVLAILLLIVFGLLRIFSKPQAQPPTINFPISSSITSNFATQAAFTIYTNGTKRDFTDSRYHNQSPDMYLEAPNPQIVHVKRAGATWGDFFSTLPMKITKECIVTGTGQNFCTNNSSSLKFYVNGKRDDGALERAIEDNDQLLVSYGPPEDPNIDEQLRQANIMPYM